MPSDAEITRLTADPPREHDDALDDNDRRQIRKPWDRAPHPPDRDLGLPTTQSPALDPNLEGQP
jgi:hypothetical protein